MKKLLFQTLLFAWCATGAIDPANAQIDVEREALTRTVLDYAEGWYEGNAERMERSLHPDLAKRTVVTRDGRGRLDHMGALALIQYTRAGGGSKTQKDKQLKDIVVFDVFGNAATVRLVMEGWIDYIQLVKLNGQWKIANVLWELKPKAPDGK